MEENPELYQQSLSFKNLAKQRDNLPPPTEIQTRSLYEVGIALFADNPADPNRVQYALRAHLADMVDTLDSSFWQSENERQQYFYLIDNLYSVYNLAASESSQPSWLADFKNFDTFSIGFLPVSTSAPAKAAFLKSITEFTRTIVNPMSIRTISNDEDLAHSNEFYQAGGDWVIIPSPFETHHLHTIARPSIIEEVITKLLPEPPGVYYRHYTSTAALPGIKRQKSLIGATFLSKKREKLVSGERFTNFGLIEDSKHGHIHVYAYEPNQKENHNVWLRWFDESPVLFQLDGEQHRAWAETSGLMQTLYQQYKGSVLAKSANAGILMGPIVPIENMVIASTWEKDMEKLSFMSTKGVKLISLEALHVFKHHRAAVQQLALNEKISEAEAWSNLINYTI